MAIKQISKPLKCPAAVRPDDQARRGGDLLFGAGQVPLHPADAGGALPKDTHVKIQIVAHF